MSKCKGCAKEIVWGTTVEGTKIPLDPRAPVYSLQDGNRIAKVERGSFMVTHFSTCPKANEFSASRKNEVP